MTPQDLQHFLHTHIPATAALQLEVTACNGSSVSMTMPHAPNRNHKNTVFGGSISLAATTCGWAAAHLLCPEAQGNIVIQESRFRYLQPALNGLQLTAETPSEEEAAQFRAMLAATGKGKISLKVNVFSDGLPVAVMQGRYVALGAKA